MLTKKNNLFFLELGKNTFTNNLERNTNSLIAKEQLVLFAVLGAIKKDKVRLLNNKYHSFYNLYLSEKQF